MTGGRLILMRGFWLGLALLFVVDLILLTTSTGTSADDQQRVGPIQKIFCLHLPVVFNTFLAFTTGFVASVGYLWQRRDWWDDLASAAVRVAVQFCGVVLFTGLVCGRLSQGAWWTPSPPLIFTFTLFLLYVIYLLVRHSIQGRERRAVIAAVYAVVSFLDVPLVWLSTRLMPDAHPGSVEIPASMQMMLAAWFVPITLMAGGLIFARFVLNRHATLACPAGVQ